MNLRSFIRNKIKSVLSENAVLDKVKKIILSSDDLDGFANALKVQYGNTVPLYHATTLELSKIIDVEGLKLTDGNNRLNWSSDANLYFQIGKSDYHHVDSERCVLYKWDAPVDFIYNYATADLDNVDTSDEELEALGIDLEGISSEMEDVIRYFVWNDMQLHGMELLIMDVNEDGNFPVIRPTKIS